jgi:hypothetical protein
MYKLRVPMTASDEILQKKVIRKTVDESKDLVKLIERK